MAQICAPPLLRLPQFLDHVARQYNVLNMNTDHKITTSSWQTNELYGRYEEMAEWKVTGRLIDRLALDTVFHPVIIPRGVVKTEQDGILYFHQAILQPILTVLAKHLEIGIQGEHHETGTVTRSPRRNIEGGVWEAGFVDQGKGYPNRKTCPPHPFVRSEASRYLKTK